jgi:protein-disulfide isomerase
VSTAPRPSLKPPLSDRDHIKGLPGAPIELVEYGDFECPHCGRAALVVEQLTQELGERLRFSFRHFPLSKMHPHARSAAQAAEAAGAQGKFWEMHDLLFANASALEPQNLVEYAMLLELDVARFENEMASETYAARVQEDVASGVRSGVNGTPTFFINGRRHNGAYTHESLMEGIVMTQSTD